MTEEFAHKVYDILVAFGARESDRDSFVYDHTRDKYPATEWRFCGVFCLKTNTYLRLEKSEH